MVLQDGATTPSPIVTPIAADTLAPVTAATTGGELVPVGLLPLAKPLPINGDPLILEMAYLKVCVNMHLLVTVCIFLRKASIGAPRRFLPEKLTRTFLRA